MSSVIRAECTYRPNQIWYEYHQQDNIREDEEESQERDHVGSQPQRQQLDEAIPLGHPLGTCPDSARSQRAYVVLEDVVRDQRFIDAGVFVRPQVDEGLFRHALVCGHL